MSELDHAIEVLEHGRQTHTEWIEYLKETPEFDTELVGDIEHHEWYLTGYDPAIRTLRLVANPNIEAAARQGYIAYFGDDEDFDNYDSEHGEWIAIATKMFAAALTPGDTDE